MDKTIIFCEESRDLSKITRFLKENGVTWANGMNFSSINSSWDIYSSETVYFIEGNIVTYGSRFLVDSYSKYDKFKKINAKDL